MLNKKLSLHLCSDVQSFSNIQVEPCLRFKGVTNNRCCEKVWTSQNPCSFLQNCTETFIKAISHIICSRIRAHLVNFVKPSHIWPNYLINFIHCPVIIKHIYMNYHWCHDKPTTIYNSSSLAGKKANNPFNNPQKKSIQCWLRHNSRPHNAIQEVTRVRQSKAIHISKMNITDPPFLGSLLLFSFGLDQ